MTQLQRFAATPGLVTQAARCVMEDVVGTGRLGETQLVQFRFTRLRFPQFSFTVLGLPLLGVASRYCNRVSRVAREVGCVHCTEEKLVPSLERAPRRAEPGLSLGVTPALAGYGVARCRLSQWRFQGRSRQGLGAPA